MSFSPEPRSVGADPALAERELARLARRRWRMRMMRFIGAEILALALLVFSILAGISERFVAESWTPLFRALPIVAAAVAVILPILFFGGPKRRGRFR